MCAAVGETRTDGRWFEESELHQATAQVAQVNQLFADAQRAWTHTEARHAAQVAALREECEQLQKCLDKFFESGWVDKVIVERDALAARVAELEATAIIPPGHLVINDAAYRDLCVHDQRATAQVAALREALDDIAARAYGQADKVGCLVVLDYIRTRAQQVLATGCE
jgi:hypothetical protein